MLIPKAPWRESLKWPVKVSSDDEGHIIMYILKNLTKESLATMVKDLQEENRLLRKQQLKLDGIDERLEEIHSKLIMSKNANNLLSSRIVMLEQKTNEMSQYQTRMP